MLASLEAGNQRVTGLDTDTDETFETPVTRRDNPWRAYLTIIEGCDKACSYCVVPFTRGPERSRASDSILKEVRQLAELGYSEVQLLGQTVNSYADPTARRMRFSELLLAVADVAVNLGLPRAASSPLTCPSLILVSAPHANPYLR